VIRRPNLFTQLYGLYLVLMIINLSQYSIALLISSITTKSATYQSISLIILNFQMFLGGLTFPPEMFPDLLLKIVKFLNPIYYALIAMRGVWTENITVFNFYKELGIVLLVTVTFIIIAMMVKRRTAEE